MGSPKLATPKIHVVMHDGSEFDVQAYNVDLVAWDRERARQKWPKPDEAPFLWMNYLAWHALTKTQGLLPAMALKAFEAAAASVSSPAEEEGSEPGDDDDEDGEDDGVDPTNPDPAPG